jgi:acyl-CoA synthetase (AMP-forming)/AMP-acid ligase II
VVIDADDDFNLVYSSGTTSEPNGIVQSHAMRLGHAIRAKRFGYDPSSVTLLSTPLSSNITTVALFATLVHGGTVILMPKFDVRQYLAIAEAERVTHTTMVPVQYERILAHPEFDRYDLSSFKIMLSIGSQLRADIKRDIVARWPGQMFDFYSSTEGGVTCILPVNAHPDKLHTIGKPAPGNDVRMIDDEGRELPRGAIGEMVGHSPTMMRGYFKQPAKTAQISWRDTDGNVFYKTGDVGRYDEDGFIVLHDRKKDMIISGGLNVYPADIENIVAKHPAVQDVAVIGVPSERWGETPVAIVVRRSGAVAGADEIRDWANEQLGKPQRISVVEFRSELPRSNTGKVLKRQLRETYVKTAAH